MIAIACLAVIDSEIPQDSGALEMKTKALRKCKGRKQCIELHCVERAYCVSTGKLCWTYNEQGDFLAQDPACKSCKKPSISGPIFNQLSTRRPLNPDPEPARANKNEWATYGELAKC